MSDDRIRDVQWLPLPVSRPEEDEQTRNVVAAVRAGDPGRAMEAFRAWLRVAEEWQVAVDLDREVEAGLDGIAEVENWANRED